MKLIVGLGNPSEKYQNTRHNLGFMVVEQLARRLTANAKWKQATKFQGLVFRHSAQDLIIFKPQTFMNNSGQAIVKIVNYYKTKPNDILIVRDDIDMEVGKIRGPKKETGSGGHRGVESAIAALGNANFWQLKIGIGRPENNISAEVYVLQTFTEEENQIIKNSIEQTVEIVEKWLN